MSQQSQQDFVTQPTAAGYLVAWGIPETRVPYEKLVEIANEVGFPEEALPTRPDPRFAWECGTSLGSSKRGVRIETSSDINRLYRQEYGVAPDVRVYTTAVKNTAPILIRHLVREAKVAYADDGPVGVTVRQQRKNNTVAMLKYDDNAKDHEAYKLTDPDDLIEATIVDHILAGIEDSITDQIENADGQSIRAGIRRFLAALYPTLLKAGLYFVPARIPSRPDLDVGKALKAFKDLLDRLREYAVSADDSPTCIIYAVHPESDVFDTLSEVYLSTTAEIAKATQELVDRIEKASAKSGKRRTNMTENILEDWQQITDKVATYGEIIGQRLSGLDATLEKVGQALVGLTGQAGYGNVQILIKAKQQADSLTHAGDDASQPLEVRPEQLEIGGFEIDPAGF